MHGNDFGIPMTEASDKEVFDMCNLSSYVENRGIEKGRLETIKEIVSSGAMSAGKAAKVFGLPIEKIKEICSE